MATMNLEIPGVMMIAIPQRAGERPAEHWARGAWLAPARGSGRKPDCVKEAQERYAGDETIQPVE